MIQKSEERKSDLRNTTVLDYNCVILVLMLVVYSVNTRMMN